MFKRLQRTWQLGLLAKDLAQVRLRRAGLASEQARHRVVDRLAHLHGLPQKLGQLLALSELEDTSAYAPLTEKRVEQPLDELLPMVEAALGRKWSECFQTIETEGIAASLAQVHRATLLDGRTVAVKIQYPDSASNVASDLNALDWLSLPFGGLGRGFDLGAYRGAVGTMLLRELNYRDEASNLQRFAKLTANTPWVVVPEIVPELCTDTALTMSWMPGESLAEVKLWPEEDRRQAACHLLRLFLTSCFRWHMLHADPNPGNYRFERTHQGVRIVLLDFGCVQTFDSVGTSGSLVPGEKDYEALAKLIELAQGSPTQEQVLSSYLALGFNPDLLAPMAHLLPALNQLLFAPFRTEEPFRMASWNLGQRVEELLGSFRWNFRYAGPANLIFLVRAYLGLLRYLDALDVSIRWSALWREVMQEDNLGSKNTAEEKKSPASSLAATKSLCLSRYLRVRVQEDGVVRVDLTFKATLAESLVDLIPSELEENLRGRGVDVSQIAADAVRRHYAAGELFQWTEGSKRVRVWLE